MCQAPYPGEKVRDQGHMARSLIGPFHFICSTNTTCERMMCCAPFQGQKVKVTTWVIWSFCHACSIAECLFHRFALYMAQMKGWYVIHHFQMKKVKVTRGYVHRLDTGNWTVCWAAWSGSQQKNYQSSALLAVSEGKSSMTGGFPSQRVSSPKSVSMAWH